MEEDNSTEERKHFFDVDWYNQGQSEGRKAPGPLGRLYGRVTSTVDSLTGFFVGMLFLVIVFGTFLMVALGFYFGPLAFFGMFAVTIGGLAFAAEKKHGRSLQFEDHDFLKKTAAQILGMSLGLGLILFLVMGLPWLMSHRLF